MIGCFKNDMRNTDLVINKKNFVKYGDSKYYFDLELCWHKQCTILNKIISKLEKSLNNINDWSICEGQYNPDGTFVFLTGLILNNLTLLLFNITQYTNYASRVLNQNNVITHNIYRQKAPGPKVRVYMYIYIYILYRCEYFHRFPFPYYYFYRYSISRLIHIYLYTH